MLAAPSAATTQRARSGSRASERTVTPSASSWTELTAAERCTRTPARSASAASRPSVAHCGTVRMYGYGERSRLRSKPPSRRPRDHISTVSTRRPSECSDSASPLGASASSVRACRSVARDSVTGPGRRSSTTTPSPARASSRAALSPTGPAPTTTTSTSAPAPMLAPASTAMPGTLVGAAKASARPV
ncbi:hypothetical protein M444_04010 [Streptomyces sp. Mg1]|nr:hypothetical protein M444_04010 [Streptomyces sp. Mg1]